LSLVNLSSTQSHFPQPLAGQHQTSNLRHVPTFHKPGLPEKVEPKFEQPDLVDPDTVDLSPTAIDHLGSQNGGYCGTNPPGRHSSMREASS